MAGRQNHEAGRTLRRKLLRTLGVASLLCLLCAPSALAADRIYWSDFDNNLIRFANLDGSGGGDNLSTAGTTPTSPFGLAYDPVAGKIYWPNFNGNTIAFANIDGSGGGGQLSTTGANTNFIRGVAIDPATRRIYWTNAIGAGISFANLDGSGGGDLSTAGAQVSNPAGVAIDPAAGRIYWANINGQAISYANLDGSGGGNLSTAGSGGSNPFGVATDSTAGRIYWGNLGNSTISYANLDGSGGGAPLSALGVNNPRGLAIDPVAGRIYVANNASNTITFASLDGSGGGGLLSTAPLSPVDPSFPILLKAPLGTGAPSISGGGEVNQELACNQGDWAPDLIGAFLYRAPRSFAYQWRVDGSDIGSATQPTFTPTTPGEYSCRVTATNESGSTSQASAPRRVPLDPPAPTPDPTPPTPELTITGLERNRATGTATLIVATNLGGALRVERTRKVRAGGPVELDESGSTELQIVPRARAAETLRRTGRLNVNPKVLFAAGGGVEISARHRFDLRRR